jgi:hypothetical protein
MFKRRIIPLPRKKSDKHGIKEAREKIAREYEEWELSKVGTDIADQTLLEEKLIQNPLDGSAHNALARIRLNRTDLDGAERNLRVAQAANKGKIEEYDTLTSLAYLEFLRQNYGTSAHYLTKAIEVAEERGLYEDKDRRDWDHLVVADALRLGGQRYGAIRYLRDNGVNPELIKLVTEE